MIQPTQLLAFTALLAFLPAAASAQAPPPGIPQITSAPASVTRPTGLSSTLTVGATGNATLSYQWLRGTASSPTAEIAGATGPTYFLASPTTADTAYYSVRVSNSLGSITTAPVLVKYDVSAGGPASTILPSYIGGPVNGVLPRDDGSFAFGGNFSLVQAAEAATATTLRGLARVLPDGSLDPDFVKIVASSGTRSVSAMVRDSAGRLLLGGNNIDAVTAGGPSPANVGRLSFARILADGTLDQGFASPFAALAAVNAIAVEASGTILIGGSFSSAATGLTGTRYLVRVDGGSGVIDSSFNPAIPSQVNAVQLVGDKILIGHNTGMTLLNGDPGGTTDSNFSYLGGSSPASAIQPLAGGDFLIGRASASLLRITATGALAAGFPASGSTPSGVTELLALSSGNFIAGGTFTTFSGTTVNRIAHLAADGTLAAGLSFGLGFNNSVNTLALDSLNRLWIGGAFSSYNGGSADQLVCLSIDATATPDPGAPTPDAYTQYLMDAGIAAERRGTADDPDGDGSTNQEEFNNATDPSKPSSLAFRLTTAGVGATVSVTPVSASGLYPAGTSVELGVAPFPSLTFLGWGPSTAAADTTQPLTVVMNQNHNLTAYAGLPVAASLDTPSLTWTTGGAVLWTGTAATSQDGVDAAIVSGLNQAGQESWMETSVTGPGVLTLRWKLTTTNANGAILQVLKNGSQLQQLAATAGAFNAYTVNLTDSGPLTLRLRLTANVNGGVSPSDTALIDKFYFGPFIAPALLPPTNLTSTSATLNWAEVPGTSGYDIQVGTNAAFTGTVKYFWAERDVLSQAVPSLTAGTLYYYRITAYGPAGTTAAKSTGTFTPAERAAQTIDFPQPPAKTFGDPPFQLAATATSGLPVAFEVVSGPGSINGSAVTLTGGGEVVLRASQAGDSQYLAATPVERTLSVAKAAQTLTFAQPPNLPADPLAYQSLVAATSSGLPVTFSVDSGPALIVDGMLQISGTGVVRITASQAGNASYLAAAPISREFTAMAPPAASPMKLSSAGKLPGGYGSAAKAISGDGSMIVGWATTAGSNNEAFRGSPAAGITGLGDLPGSSFDSLANAASQDGSVVVGHGVSAAGLEAFRWTSAGMVGLGDLPGGSASSRATAVSLDGAVVVGMGQNNSFLNEAIRWTQAGGMIPIGILPGGDFSQALGVSGDGNTVVGVSSATGVAEMAFRWVSVSGLSALGDLPGGETRSRANAISANGTVIVGQSTSANGREAFRWTAADGMAGLGDLPGGSFQSEALAVSADGTVIVGTATTASGPQAMIWDAAHGMRSLRELLSAAGLASGWSFHSAAGISADGRFVTGAGTNRSGASEAWLLDLTAPPPGPATVALLWTEDLPQTEPFKANCVLRLGDDNGANITDIATQLGANGGFNGVEYANSQILVPNQGAGTGTRSHHPAFSPLLVTNVWAYDLDARPGELWNSNGNAKQIIRSQPSASPTLSGGIYDYTYTPLGTTNVARFAFAVQAVGSTVYFSNPSNNPIGLYKMNTDGTGITAILTASDAAAPLVYDFEVLGSQIYFCDIASSAIKRVNTDGSGLLTLVANVDFPNAIDVTSDGIYWTELLNGRIRRADLTGGNVAELVTGLVSPRGVAVMPLSFVVPTDPLNAYVAAANVPEGQRGATDDPDGDGLSNLIEFGLGLAPNTADAAGAPKPVRTATHLTYTYRGAQAGLTYVVQTSADMTAGSWSAVGVDQGTPAPNGTTTASIPLGSGKQFLRLSVTLNP